MSERSETADLLKGIAVILMVNVHVFELFATPGICNSNFGRMLLFLGAPPVAPVFTVILGYFIAASQKTMKQQIIRGMRIIILGVILNIALNLNLIISVSKGIFKLDLLPYIFGIDILQFAGLCIIIMALLKKAFEQSMVLLAVCIVISGFLGHFLLDYVPGNTLLKYVFSPIFGSCTWSYFPLFPWLSYPLTGFIFYQLRHRVNFILIFKIKTKILLAFLFALFLLFTINYAVSITSDLQSYYHHGFLFYLWVIAFISFYSFFTNEIDKVLGETVVLKYLKWMGKNVTVIYVIQWVIIGNMATQIYQTVSSPAILLICVLGVIFISCCIGYFSIILKEKVRGN